MKKLLVSFFSAMFGVLLATSASAQTYPYTNPTYIPNATFPAFTVASAVSSTAMRLNGIGTVTLQLSGACTGLTGAALEASTDGTNYKVINMYPYNATTAASAVTSTAAPGVYVANVAGYRNVRLTNTGVTGACTGILYGSPVAFTLPR